MRLESGDVRLELRPDKPDVIEARARTGGEARTHVHVKQRWFDRELAGTLPEVFSLKERCALSTVPVSVNGEVVSQGRDLAGAIVQVPIDAPGFVGVAGFLPDAKERRTSALSLIRDGVRITSEVWEDVEPRSIPFVVRVEGGVLRKDASQSSIVRDEAYERLLEVVYRSYFEALAAALREEPTARWARESSGTPSGPTRGRCGRTCHSSIAWPRP